MSPTIVGVTVKDYADGQLYDRYLIEGESLHDLIESISHDIFQSLIGFIYSTT